MLRQSARSHRNRVPGWSDYSGTLHAVPTESLNTKKLGKLELPDAYGEVHRVGDLWADQTLILVFLRHFG